MARPDLVIAHLYSDLLRTYGDRGNVLTLAKRAEWRGFRVEVGHPSIGDRLPPGTDLVFVGGGTDRVQEVVGDDLAGRRHELLDAAASGAVLVGVCGGYQLLGRRYVSADGRVVPGVGLLDVETTADSTLGRIIGRVQAQADLWGRSSDLFGFENHGGRTWLGADVRPLASVPKGQGNNGVDGTEGAVADGVVGTYLHGPVLPANPQLADALLERALAGVTEGAPLAPLDDNLERLARAEARDRKR